ncbi:unnamed protein product [Periconia digitata]|uniref:Uncharacterized protein n=1 Tax=Periconia digitata TaxID=1303443 RepID=A0A9W4UKQ7_9PLEO|nr:unnamed protein product [Periconia digitata]
MTYPHQVYRPRPMSVTHVSPFNPAFAATPVPEKPPSPSLPPHASEARHANNTDENNVQNRADRDNALAHIQFTSIVDPDLTPSEDESAEERSLQLETVQSAIGVSMGQQQTRLTSPKTPAAEKAAALDDVDGGGLFEGWDQSVEQDADEQSDTVPASDPAQPPPKDAGDTVKQKTPQVNPPTTASSPPRPAPAPRLPSPWRAGPKPLKVQGQSNGQSNSHRSALRETLVTKARRRTLSGGSSMGESFKKYFNLPSLPKSSGLLNFSLPSFSPSQFDSHVRGRPPPNPPRQRPMQLASSLPNRSPRSPLVQYDGNVESTRRHPTRNSPPRRSSSLNRLPPHPATAPLPIPESTPSSTGQGTPRLSAAPSQPKPLSRPASVLRRSTSEGSLMIYRSRSIASSLGDDSRFENVSEMVNSRMKAIKDSWQDANFRLSVPSLPNFNFGSRDDLFKSSRVNSPSLQATNATDNAAASMSNNRANLLQENERTASNTSTVNPSSEAQGPANANSVTHPHFTRALQEIEGDLVILGGYRGSILRSAEPPNRQLWVPIKVGLNLRKVDLEVGLEPEDELTMEERIIPGGMLTNIGPVDISKRLLKRLRASENARKGTLRVHDYGYDWRLSPHLLARRMIKFLEELPCNQPDVLPEKRGAIVLAHSLGGLITRHVINQRPELVSGVVYAGVPQNCINILGPLRNGDDVLLSSRVLTAQVNFTIRTSFALLPLDGKCFINKDTKEEYPLDFFDPNTWEENRLSPCIAPALPAPNLPQPSNYSMTSLLNAMSQALPTRPSRKASVSRSPAPRSPALTHQDSTGTTGTNGTMGSSSTSNPTGSSSALSSSGLMDTARNATSKFAEGAAQTSAMEPSMQSDSATPNNPAQPNPATAVTIPKDKAMTYLSRTLAEIKQFKEELAHNSTHTAANAYPPIALIYGKSTPTVYGAKVESREAIKLTSCYDELAFASGDGVVLAKAAMVPSGYSVVRGGLVPSERGHVTLLGDLEAVGKCLVAVIKGRRRGVGLGTDKVIRENEGSGKAGVKNDG